MHRMSCLELPPPPPNSHPAPAETSVSELDFCVSEIARVTGSCEIETPCSGTATLTRPARSASRGRRHQFNCTLVHTSKPVRHNYVIKFSFCKTANNNFSAFTFTPTPPLYCQNGVSSVSVTVMSRVTYTESEMPG